jgi:DNA anti-recombination protein RmuC
LAFAGLLIIALKTIKHFFNTHNQSDQTNEFNEIIKNIQKSVGDMQTTVAKLDQTVDQLNSSMQTAATNRSSTSSIEEIKREVQLLKGLYLGRSQFPQVPSRQLITTEVC